MYVCVYICRICTGVCTCVCAYMRVWVCIYTHMRGTNKATDPINTFIYQHTQIKPQAAEEAAGGRGAALRLLRQRAPRRHLPVRMRVEICVYKYERVSVCVYYHGTCRVIYYIVVVYVYKYEGVCVCILSCSHMPCHVLYGAPPSSIATPQHPSNQGT